MLIILGGVCEALHDRVIGSARGEQDKRTKRVARMWGRDHDKAIAGGLGTDSDEATDAGRNEFSLKQESHIYIKGKTISR